MGEYGGCKLAIQYMSACFRHSWSRSDGASTSSASRSERPRVSEYHDVGYVAEILAQSLALRLRAAGWRHFAAHANDDYSSAGAHAVGWVAYVVDTVALAAPAWHDPVAAGGTTAVASLASYNGTNWQYE